MEVSAVRIIAVILFLSFIIGTGLALIPDQITIGSNTEWLVANGFDNATITVQAFNASNPLSGVTVDFSLVSTEYGTMPPVRKGTGADGTASVVFTANTKSGNALIHSVVSYTENNMTYTVEKNYIQKIDHDTPYQIAYINYPYESPVGSVVQLLIRLQDRNKNPIDNLRDTEYLHLVAGSPAGTPESGLTGFWNGVSYIQNFSAPVNQNGEIAVNVRLATKSGANIIWIDRQALIPESYLAILGISDNSPYSIERTITPSTGWQYADGTGTFEIEYHLLDQYGNGVRNCAILINTTAPDEPPKTVITNDEGQVSISYGPKDTVGMITITASVLSNITISCSDSIEFVSNIAEDMVLTAIPQTMASRDAETGATSDIMAKIIDEKGNPVEGEAVAFDITDISYPGVYNITANPSLITNNSLSNLDGFATIQFVPGAFSINEDDLHYEQAATGSATIRATWLRGGITPVNRDVTVVWKNYPYLSVSTLVSPQTVAVNDTVDVTVRLIGDGYLMKPKPVDIILTLDRSGSMDTKDMENNWGVPNSITRLNAAKTAAINFVDAMNQTSDRIGLVIYSDTSGLKNSIEDNSSDKYSLVKSNISIIDANGYTATRDALRRSIQNLIDNPNSDPKAIRSVILMTDGEYNRYGDPLAREYGYNSSYRDDWGYYYRYGYWDGNRIDRYTLFSGLGGSYFYGSGNSTNQNMTLFAKNNKIRLYTISFSNSISEGSNTWNVMDNLAEKTNGTHYHATSSAELNEVYYDIAGKLKTEAGVNTTMNITFGTVSVNEESFNGSAVFDYVYQEGVSTRIKWPTGIINTVNHTSEWQEARNISFNVGTLKLNEVWEGTFRFKVLKAGNIDIFGENSWISFNNGENMLRLPKTYITAVPDLTNIGSTGGNVTISGFEAASTSPDTIYLSWNLNYTGTKTANEEALYSTDDGISWKRFGSYIRSNGLHEENTEIDLRQIPRTTRYMFRIEASGSDGGWDRKDTQILLTERETAFIKIE